MKTSPNVFKCYLLSPSFLWGLEKATKIFSFPNSFLQWVSNGVLHPRHCSPPTSNCPPISSYAPNRLSTSVQLCPLQTTTYVQLCPPPTVHYRCPRFLPPAPPADVVAIMKGCLQDIYVLYIYVPTGLQKNITKNSPHNNSSHLADDQGGFQWSTPAIKVSKNSLL